MFFGKKKVPRRVGTERDERHIVERVFLGMRIHNADDGINARAAVRRGVAVPQSLPEDILIGRNGDTFPRRQSSVKFKTAALTFRPNELLGGIDIAARTKRFKMNFSIATSSAAEGYLPAIKEKPMAA